MLKSLLSIFHGFQISMERWTLAVCCFLILNISIAGTNSLSSTVLSNYPLYAWDFSELTNFNDNAYFIISNTELWKSDGTAQGTVRMKKFALISNLEVSSGSLFFSANNDEAGTELWKSDGTVEGTVMVKDIRSGAEGSAPCQLTNLNGTLYFVAHDGAKGKELWTSDGTEEGTKLVKDIMRVSGSSNPSHLVTMNNKLYFSANDGTNGYEVWTSDGTASGTTMVFDINPGAKRASSPEKLVNADGVLYFVANDGVNGKQLWKSDGTSSGTSLVKIIRPGGNNALDHLTNVNGVVFFQANDGIHGTELWKSDGTEMGTNLVKDFTPGPKSETGYATAHLDHFSSANGKLYFLVFNGSRNLWVSDGTESGTIQLTTLWGISFSWIDPFVTEYNGEAVFIAHGENSLDLFKTNGTPEGTVHLQEYIGEMHESNAMPTLVGNELFFVGTGSLWKTDGTSAGTVKIRDFVEDDGSETDEHHASARKINGNVGSLLTDEEITIASYPNPFTEQFSIRVNGKTSDKFKLNVYTMSGASIAAFDELPCNTDHAIGHAWQNGIYILKVYTGDKLTIQKVVKTNQ